MIRILVIEEVRAVCETLAAALTSEPGLEVCGCATSLAEALPHLRSCDIALLNLTANTENAAGLIRNLRRLAPRTKLVVMGLAPSQPLILQCVEAGVAGYVLRDSPLAEVLASVRAAAHNEAHVSPPIAAALMSFVAELVSYDPAVPPDRDAAQTLTRREREVLTLVQQGCTNQEIAASLVIELGTVKNHVHNILRKLNVSSRRDAVHVSRLAGLWSAPEPRPEFRPEPRLKPLAPRPAERPVYSSALGANT